MFGSEYDIIGMYIKGGVYVCAWGVICFLFVVGVVLCDSVADDAV